jgi:hypothetical protein
MPNLRNLVRKPVEPSPPSPLELLVREAAAKKVEIKRLEAMDGQLTPEAYAAAALGVSGASEAERDQLAAALAKPENAPLLPSFRRLCAEVKRWRRTAPLKVLGPYVDEAGDATIARLRVTRQSLFALAAQTVAKESPQIFGRMKVVGEYDAAVSRAAVELKELIVAIDAGWQRSDVTEVSVSDELRERGCCKLTANISGGRVHVGKDFAQRLVADWCAHHAVEVAEAA